jgi:uncharacterized FAD-dependent dehydrogenase
MPRRIIFTLPFDADVDAHVRSAHPDARSWRVVAKSLDARGAPRGRVPTHQWTVDMLVGPHDAYEAAPAPARFAPLRSKPLIIGAGPAGLFCAVKLAEHGIPSIVLERGASADKRMLKISRFWRHGELDPDTNVCYGEGGAGLYSDGKLITRIKSDHVPYVMQKLVDFGAPAEVAYISNPHLGSNKIRAIIGKLTDWLRGEGCELRHNARVVSLLYEGGAVVGVELADGEKIYSNHVVLAAGHSAHEIYEHLLTAGVAVTAKDFSLGVRIEHSRREIDRLQHGRWSESAELGAARYRLSWHDHTTDIGVYSFCMCPGGYVLSSGTETDGLVVNGMSNFARNSPWSNAALVVTVRTGQLKENDVLAGLRFQRSIEQAAFKVSKREATGREIPAMTVGEFLGGKLDQKPLPSTSCPSHIFKTDLRELFPQDVVRSLAQGLLAFEKNLPGFTRGDAVLMAPETRTSSPLTITRDRTTYQSPSHQGLYPCGEGAGYAGGITSAAVDGVRVAHAIMAQEKLLPPQAP